MNVIQSGDKLIVDSKEIKLEKGMRNRISIINGQLYVDGREYVDGKWNRTLAATWHKYF